MREPRSGIVRVSDVRSEQTTYDSPAKARTLHQLTAHAPNVPGVHRRHASPGDWIVVYTKNSRYVMLIQSDYSVVVSGGWFDRESGCNRRVHIAGCTWGGSAILTGMFAAPGMFIEFSNGVRTTRVREVRIVPAPSTITH